jgi:hypothetical protein
MGTGGSVPVVKVPECEAYHVPAYSDDVRLLFHERRSPPSSAAQNRLDLDSSAAEIAAYARGNNVHLNKYGCGSAAKNRLWKGALSMNGAVPHASICLPGISRDSFTSTRFDIITQVFLKMQVFGVSVDKHS